MTAEVYVRSRGYLPHWERKGGIYFVTFHLADSLPRKVLQEIVAERDDIPKTAGAMRRPISMEEKKRLSALYSEKVSRYLDAGHGNCILTNPLVSRIVRDTLQEFDGTRYDLLAWCIMPNHVHVVFRVKESWNLEKVLHTWKSYSTNRIQRQGLHKGRVWQREYYDHLVRHPGELERVVRYVNENPGRAGLQDWPWVEVLLK